MSTMLIQGRDSSKKDSAFVLFAVTVSMSRKPWKLLLSFRSLSLEIPRGISNLGEPDLYMRLEFEDGNTNYIKWMEIIRKQSEKFSL